MNFTNVCTHVWKRLSDSYLYKKAELKRALGTTELRAPLVINKGKSPEKENNFLEAAQHLDARIRPGSQVFQCPVARAS